MPNPYSRQGGGMILKSASAFEDDNDNDGSVPEKLKSVLLMAHTKKTKTKWSVFEHEEFYLKYKMKCFWTWGILYIEIKVTLLRLW